MSEDCCKFQRRTACEVIQEGAAYPTEARLKEEWSSQPELDAVSGCCS